VKWWKSGARSGHFYFEVYNAWRFTFKLFYTHSSHGAYVQEGHIYRKREILCECVNWIDLTQNGLIWPTWWQIPKKKQRLYWSSEQVPAIVEFPEPGSLGTVEVYVSPWDSYSKMACSVYCLRQDAHIYGQNTSVLLYLHSE
jgi:hypothetical protein